MANRWGNNRKNDMFYFGGAPQSLQMTVAAAMKIKRCLLLERKAMTNLDSVLKNREITLLIKVHTVKTIIFPRVMYGCEIWIIKKGEHQRTDSFELWSWRRLLRITWTARRSNQSIPKENQSWIFIGRTNVEAEATILLPPDVENQFIGKNPDAGKDWRQEKGMTENEVDGWHHWLNGQEFEQGVGEGKGSPARCSPWGRNKSDMTEWLNNNDKNRCLCRCED